MLHHISATLRIMYTHSHTYTYIQPQQTGHCITHIVMRGLRNSAKILWLKQAIPDEFHFYKNVAIKQWVAMFEKNSRGVVDMPEQCTTVLRGWLQDIDFSRGTSSVRLRESFPTSKGDVKSKYVRTQSNGLLHFLSS